MPSYTLDELLERMEPQAQRDKALMERCVDGLGLYAAGKAADNRFASEIEDMRKLVGNLIGYWGLDDNEKTDGKTSEDFLGAFDSRIYEAKTGGKITGDVYQSGLNVINGLYRYGEEMVACQGEAAMSDILDIGDLMKEIAEYWNFETEISDDLTARLESEVRDMLKNAVLPGWPVSGENVNGYIINRVVLFSDDRGFALAHNPAEPSPFVTWQFTNDNGRPDYYWGRYVNSEVRALADYVSRTVNYKESHLVTEKPLPQALAELERCESGESNERPSVIETIRATQKAPREPKIDTPSKQKDKGGPEL
jgi:hypothetical protein